MKLQYQERAMHELCEITSSKRIFAADYQTEGVPFFRGKEITERFNGALGVSTELFISRQKFEEIKEKFGVPESGDLLLTSVGTLGSTYVVQPEDEFYFKDGNITWFRKFKGLNSNYLHYWLGSPAGKAEQKKCTIGSSQSAYTIVLLKEMKIALPPLEEQERIASILSAYDDLIENNTRRIAILEEMARRIYEEWFVHFRFPGHEQVKMVESELGLIPEGWEATTLDAVSEYINRGLTPKYDDQAEWLVINQKCIRGQKLSYELARRQSKPIPVDKRVRYGDVLINSTGVGTLGRVAQVLDERPNCTVDTHVTIARPGKQVKAHFYGLALYAREQHFEQQGVGATGQTELGRGRVAETPLILPPAVLQEQFDEIVAPMRRLVVTLGTKSANLRTTRDLLLPKLISGELDVSNPPVPEEAIAA